jgi:hypothetical protein
MYKIRFTNSEGKTVTTTIVNKKDLNKIGNTDAKDAIIDCQIGSGMSVSLHNAIAEHNAKVRSAVGEKV